jgi:hypothetical protein
MNNIFGNNISMRDITGDFLARTRNVLHEEINVEDVPEDELLAATVDGQIDSLIFNAEKKATQDIDNDNITEAEEDDEVEDTDDTEDTEDTIAHEVPEIDTLNFASDIARLVTNYTSLLDVESVIVNRAIDFLLKNYDDVTVEEFKELLTTRFEIDFVKQDGTETSNEPETPIAAGGLSTGAGGGGAAI